MSQQIERFLTPPQVARILGCSAEHVGRFIAQGQLKATNTSFGNRPRWKISPEDFQAFVDRRSNVSSLPPVEHKKTRRPTKRVFFK